MKRTFVAAMVAATLSVGAASASTLDSFNFTAPPTFTDASSKVFTGTEGLDVTVTGKTYTNAGGSFSAGYEIDVENNSWGLISDNRPCGTPCSDPNGAYYQHSVDSYGDDEAMIFSFGEDVTLTSLSFGWYKYSGNGYNFYTGGKFNLFVDGVWKGLLSASSVVDLTASLSLADLTGSTFAVGAASYTYGQYYKNSYLKISGATTVRPDEPPPVPLPAAGWMLLAGLGGIAGLKRRRKSA